MSSFWRSENESSASQKLLNKLPDITLANIDLFKEMTAALGRREELLSRRLRAARNDEVELRGLYVSICCVMKKR